SLMGVNVPGLARAEDLREFFGHRGVELRVRAVTRIAVGAPAHELCRMPEAVALEVVEGHLADELGTQRLPLELLARVPAALGARHPAGGRLHGFRPPRPRMALERVLPVGLELADKLAPAGHAERGRHADVVE